MDWYCLYLRKSRMDAEAEARGEGETLARHEKILLDLANSRGFHIKKVYKEIVSGETIASRPVVQEMLSHIEQRLYVGVLVVEVERLARGDTIDQGIISQTFKYSGTKIVTPQKTFDPGNEFDEEYFEFGLFMSRREYKTINRRLQAGRLASVKEGKYVGNKPPYGYDIVKIQNAKGYTLTPHHDESKIVQLIYELYTAENRIGVALIVRKLNDSGIKPRFSDVWTPATIQGILKNPVYIGKVHWNARKQVKTIVDGSVIVTRPRAKSHEIIVADGLHEPIVSLEIWEKAQEYISINRRTPTPRQSEITNPLAGLIVCGKCGRKMIRRPGSKAVPVDSIMCPSTACSNVSSRYIYVEEAIIKNLLSILNQIKLDISNSEDIPHQEEVAVEAVFLVQLNKEREKLNVQISRLHDLLEQGVYTPATFLERSKLLGEKLEKLSEENAKITEILQFKQKPKDKITLTHQIDDALSLYYTLETPSLKNKLLKTIIKDITYIKESGGRWGDPRDFNLEINLHIN